MKQVTILLILCAAAGVSATADILQVPSSDWPTIQSAISAAISGDTVEVAVGTYLENINFLGKSITVRSADPDDPNTVAATIIDGSAPADPNYASAVTFSGGEGNDSILEGFTITGGTGTWLAISWRFHEIYWNRCGGGIVCYNLSQPTIRKNRIVNNRAGEGGGIYIYGDPVTPFPPVNPAIHIMPVIEGNLLENNTAQKTHEFPPPDEVYTFAEHGDGGAIVCFQGVDPAITGNTIRNNRADYYGGGIHIRQWSNGAIEDNTISDNDSTLGAGVHITYDSSPIVRKNQIRRNIAGGLGGGGIYVYSRCNPLIENNTIEQNESTSGAGIGTYWESRPIIRNNLIIKNINGAGILVTGSAAPQIFNNTICENGKGGISIETESDPVIVNNIIASNGNSYGIYAYTGPYEIRYNNVWNHPKGEYNPVIGNQTGMNGNISNNPEFLSPDDFHLSCRSFCINAGDPNTNASDQQDLDGQPRILGQFGDIGADEANLIWNLTSGSQHLLIQEAINQASDYDTLVLTPGLYKGAGNRDVTFQGKDVVLQGIDPNDPEIVEKTVIDSEGSLADMHRAFQFKNSESPKCTIRGLTFTGGMGMFEGGAIYCNNASSPTIQNCRFINNLSEGRAGAIYCGNGSSPLIEHCLFLGNAARRGYGGAIACFYQSKPLIRNCILIQNHALGHSHHGGAVCCWDHSDAVVANCIVIGNSAGHRGGGLYAYWAAPTFINCTVIGNLANQGGGIGSFRESNPQVINCIVRDNIAYYGNQLALINTSSIWQGTNIPTEMTVSYSNIQNEISNDVYIQHDCPLHWQDGNIDADPNFTDLGVWNAPDADPNNPVDDFFTPGNYHLRPVSPCRNAGNPAAPLYGNFDLDLEDRVFESRIDMGADEVYYSPADLDASGRVDLEDLAILIENWLNPDDMNAFRPLSDNWLWQGKWTTD